MFFNTFEKFLFVFFNYRKFLTKLLRLDFRSALKKQLDPDPHWEKQLDPDLQKMNAGLAKDTYHIKRLTTIHLTTKGLKFWQKPNVINYLTGQNIWCDITLNGQILSNNMQQNISNLQETLCTYSYIYVHCKRTCKI